MEAGWQMPLPRNHVLPKFGDSYSGEATIVIPAKEAIQESSFTHWKP